MKKAYDTITDSLIKKKNEYIKQQIDSFNSFENKRKKIFESLIYNNEKNEDKKNKKKEIIHKGFKCGFCNMTPIIGIRYKCNGCSSFNLCEKCYKELNSTEEKTHIYNHKFTPRNYSTEISIINEEKH